MTLPCAANTIGVEYINVIPKSNRIESSILASFLCSVGSALRLSVRVETIHKARDQIRQRAEEDDDADHDIDDLCRSSDFGLQSGAAIQKSAEQKSRKDAADR